MVVLLGGFTTNFVWCLYLNLSRGTAYEYLAARTRAPAAAAGVDAHGVATASAGAVVGGVEIPRLANYAFSALAGAVWYFQFFFYTMGETQMGRFGFASWTLHMASIIIFSTLWGWYFHEWKGSGARAHRLIALGIGMLIASTLVIGFGTYLKGGN